MADQKTQLPSKELHYYGGPPSPIKPRSLPPLLCKSSFLFLLFLVVIPLFPSQAPNFINQSVFTKLWELVHLLVIGLAVFYGLFCWRNGELDSEKVPSFEDSESSLVSRIFHDCPIFEDGYENPSGSDGKIGYYDKDVSFGSARFVRNEEEESKERLLDSEGGGSKITSEVMMKNEAWNSQYLQAEPVMVMSETSDDIGGYDEIASEVGYKLLGLPVRRLSPCSHQFSDGGLSSSSFRESSLGGCERNGNGKEFGDVCSRNLELKFDETVASWHSRSESGCMDESGGSGSVRSQSGHLSVDETQFESLHSRSFQSTTSQAGSASASSTVSSATNSEAEDHGKSKSYPVSYPPQSQSPFKTINGEAPLNAFHLRKYNSGSLFQKDPQGSSWEEPKDSRGSRSKASLVTKERKRGSDVKLDNKGPVTSSKGKTVRTAWSRRYAGEASYAGNPMKSVSNFEGNSNSDEGRKSAKLQNETHNRNLDPHYHILKPSYEEYQKRENVKLNEKESEESKEDNSKNGAESIPATPPAGAVVNETLRDTGYESSEVDRKAAEFIAKFRQQIRLQKEASINRSRRPRISSSRFR